MKTAIVLLLLNMLLFSQITPICDNSANVMFGMTIKQRLVYKSDSSNYHRYIRDCDVLTEESGFRMGTIYTAPGRYYFGSADSAVAIAERFGNKMRIHVLAYHYDVPAWLQSSSISNSQFEGYIHAYIDTVIKRYSPKQSTIQLPLMAGVSLLIIRRKTVARLATILPRLPVP